MLVGHSLITEPLDPRHKHKLVSSYKSQAKGLSGNFTVGVLPEQFIEWPGLYGERDGGYYTNCLLDILQCSSDWGYEMRGQ